MPQAAQLQQETLQLFRRNERRVLRMLTAFWSPSQCWVINHGPVHPFAFIMQRLLFEVRVTFLWETPLM